MFSGNFIVDIQSILLACIEWTRVGLISLVIRGSTVFPSKVAICSIKVPRISLIVVIVITTIRKISSVKYISISRSVIPKVRITGPIFILKCRQMLPVKLLTFFTPRLHVMVSITNTIEMSNSPTQETRKSGNLSLVHVRIVLTILNSPNFILS